MNWIDVLENYSRNSIICDVAEMSVMGDGMSMAQWDELKQTLTDREMDTLEKRKEDTKGKTMKKIGKDIWDWIESR